MKRAIEFEQTVSFKHRVVIECESDQQVNKICELSEERFDDILLKIGEMDSVKVLEASENFSEDENGNVEYHDDYWTADEAKAYGMDEAEAAHE